MNSPGLDQKLSVQVRRRFEAPRERVFRAWVEREALRQWWGQGPAETNISRLEPQVGGGFRFETRSPDGQHTVTSGRYLEVTPPERLVFTWASSITDNQETLVTVEFVAHGEATEVTLTHDRFPSAAMAARHQHGWGTLLERLAGALKPT
jgi:uncharacterized protein YndB with AHSA1/START domain